MKLLRPLVEVRTPMLRTSLVKGDIMQLRCDRTGLMINFSLWCDLELTRNSQILSLEINHEEMTSSFSYNFPTVKVTLVTLRV